MALCHEMSEGYEIFTDVFSLNHSRNIGNIMGRSV